MTSWLVRSTLTMLLFTQGSGEINAGGYPYDGLGPHTGRAGGGGGGGRKTSSRFMLLKPG